RAANRRGGEARVRMAFDKTWLRFGIRTAGAFPYTSDRGASEPDRGWCGLQGGCGSTGTSVGAGRAGALGVRVHGKPEARRIFRRFGLGPATSPRADPP